MAFERAFITLTLAVDLDGVPGNCDKPEDFVTIMQQRVKGFAHYKPEITVIGTVVKKYEWDEGKQEYIQPKLIDDPRKPKIGDKTFSLDDGEGSIIEIDELDKIVFIKISEDDVSDIFISELTWVKCEQRWEYGDLERK